MLTRPEESQVVPGEASEPFPDEKWGKKFPTVAEYMTTDRYADGSTRERSGFTVRVQEGKLVAVFNDPTVKRSLYRVGGNVEECIAAIEKALSSGNCDWRRWKEDFGGKRRK